MGSILYPELSYAVIGAAMEVHKVLGPGYLEAVYQVALAHELGLHGIKAVREHHYLFHTKASQLAITLQIWLSRTR